MSVRKLGKMVLPCSLYLCLYLHLCWQAQPARINRTRHSLVRTTVEIAPPTSGGRFFWGEIMAKSFFEVL
ncbi:MAG: hypothetical protein LBD59_02275 [Prevotellaceae bacterium]|nr:hypothetical protein [Prevotellaceae bacterium]